MPALFTRTSILPWCSSAASTSAFTWARSARSATKPCARSVPSSSARSWIRSVVEVIVTSPPSRTRARAHAMPIPVWLPHPVISAVLPSSSSSTGPPSDEAHRRTLPDTGGSSDIVRSHEREEARSAVVRRVVGRPGVAAGRHRRDGPSIRTARHRARDHRWVSGTRPTRPSIDPRTRLHRRLSGMRRSRTGTCSVAGASPPAGSPRSFDEVDRPDGLPRRRHEPGRRMARQREAARRRPSSTPTPPA